MKQEKNEEFTEKDEAVELDGSEDVSCPGSKTGETVGDGLDDSSPELIPCPEDEESESVEYLREQFEAQKEKYIRLMAEFDNYKRRTAREYEKLVESANEKLMLDIIGTRESFERALKAGENGTDYTTFYDGMKMIFTGFDQTLAKHGLSVFADIGDEFDPNIHDAMLKQPHPVISEDHIVDIYEKGYKLRSRVIKHARVIVSGGAPEQAGKNDKENTEPDNTDDKQTINR